MDYVGKRYLFFLLSAIVIVPGIVFLIISPGLKPGIDFTGGSSIMLEFADPVDETELRVELESEGHTDASVDKLEDGTYFVRTKVLNEDAKNALVDSLEASVSPDGITVLSFDLVSPVVAKETVLNALWAVIAAAVGIFLYVWWAFRNVPRPFLYGAAAIVALMHDVMIVLGIFAILGNLAGVEVGTIFLVALLTVIGYSVNDTIVIFDRLRENVINYQNRSLSANVNLSISETLGRSINTSATIMFPLLALMLFGGETLQTFLLVLIIGVVSGTYSSIGIAAQLLAAWDRGDLKRILNRVRPGASTAAASPRPAGQSG